MGTYSSTQRVPLLTQAPDKPRKKNVRTLPVPYFTLRQEAMNARSLVAARSRVAISAGSNLKQVRTLNQTRRVRFAQLRPFAIGDSIDEDTLSGEWPANWSLASYEGLEGRAKQQRVWNYANQRSHSRTNRSNQGCQGDVDERFRRLCCR